jgi:hypothetical protein
LTKVEYYIAAVDDNGQVSTFPPGGSGTNPIGGNPPNELLEYQVVIAGAPVVEYFSPAFNDTTIFKGDKITFSASAYDTTSLAITYLWKKNSGNGRAGQTYTLLTGLGAVPRTDTVTCIISNGFNQVERVWFINIDLPTYAEEELNTTDYALNQNYPNPFNPSTNISFTLPENQRVLLKIYNLIGEEIVTLLDREMSAGSHTVQFDAQNLSAGIYLARLNTGKYAKTIKMTLLK